MARPTTLCLCMIVKNEAPVIRRCLDSVRSLIDYWVIVDTGSTDGTQDIVCNVLGGPSAANCASAPPMQKPTVPTGRPTIRSPAFLVRAPSAMDTVGDTRMRR